MKKFITLLLNLITFGFYQYKRISDDKKTIDALMINIADLIDATTSVKQAVEKGKMETKGISKYLNAKLLKNSLVKIQEAYGASKRIKYNLTKLIEDGKITKD